MSIVGIYGFTGRYSGTSEYEWNHPESGEFESTTAECHRYGFEAIGNMRYGKLVVEVLNTEPYRGFSGFYEEALASGSALVFYPAEARSGGAAA